jgi:hypothetical protein
VNGVTESVRGRLWRPSRPLTDTAVVVAVCAVMTALAMTPALRGLGPPGAAVLVLTVATATVTAGAAILAEVMSRVCDDPRWSWAAAAFALYGAGGAARQRARGGRRHASLLLIRVAAYVVALPMLVLSLRPPHRLSAAVAWVLTVVGALLATAASLVPESAVPTRILVAVLVVAVLPAWTAVAVGYVVDGYRRRSGPRLAVRARSRGGRGRPAVPGGDGRTDRRPGVRRAAVGRRGGRPRRPGPAGRAVARGGALAAFRPAGGADGRGLAPRTSAGTGRRAGPRAAQRARGPRRDHPPARARARTTRSSSGSSWPCCPS